MKAKTIAAIMRDRAAIRRDIRKLKRERLRLTASIAREHKAQEAERKSYTKEREKRVQQRIDELVAVYREIESGKGGFALTDPRISVAIAAADERVRVGLEAYRALLGRLIIAVAEKK